MVIEVSRTKESYQQLLDGATLKHFSNNTTVQIWVGAKLFAGGRMKYMFRLRDQVNGGALQGSGATTDLISLGQPTTIQFIIPKSRLLAGKSPIDYDLLFNAWAERPASSRYPRHGYR